MSTHASILNLHLKLGHTKTGGLCHALAIRWLEACILGEEQLFDERIHRIEQMVRSQADVVQLVNATKAKKGQNLTKRDKEILDLLAFFESMELFQSPEKHSALFNQPYLVGSLNPVFLSYFASSERIRAKGGLTQIYSEPMVLNLEEIKKYLDDLGLVLQKSGSLKDIYGVVLTISIHTIALSYKPNTGWSFMDSNQYPAEYFKPGSDATSQLAEKIAAGFTFSTDAYQEYFAFNASIITTKDSTSIPKLTKKLRQFKASHVLTKELASREHERIGLAWTAARYGHAPFVTKIAQYGADLDKESLEGTAPIHLAAKEGHASVIAELGKYGADLNKPYRDSCPPAYLAAERGHASVIKQLGKYGANLDNGNKNDWVPACIAAEKGHASVITELGSYGANLDKENTQGWTPACIAAHEGHDTVIIELGKYGAKLDKENKEGLTPACIAAREGHAPVIRELGKYGAKLDKVSADGWSPACLAAQEGHAPVITELGIRRANLDMENEQGWTPACLAAYEGHAPVIAELGKYGANLDKENKNGYTPAFIAAQTGHALVITELGNYGANLDKESKDGLTPACIAAYAGHASVITELGKCGANLDKKDKSGLTPALIAAGKGDNRVLIELIKWGADLSKPANLTLDKLKTLIKVDDKHVRASRDHFINRQLRKGRQIMSITPYDIALIMGHTETIQLLSKVAIQSFLYKKEALNSKQENKTPNALSASPMKAPNYLLKLNALQLEQKELEAEIKNVEALIEIARKNDVRVVGRKYFTELMDEHVGLYKLVLNNTRGAAKEQMMKYEAKLRSSTVSSKLLYAASWATSLLTTGYRFFTPKDKQEYVESYLPNTLDSQSKTYFKQLTQDALDNLKKSLARSHRKVTILHEQYKNHYGAIRPFLKTLSQENLAELLNNIGNIKTTKPQARSHPKNNRGDPGAPGLGLI